MRRQRHIADFVQKNRPFVALFKLADALGGGAGERSLFVTEQLAFEQIFRNRRAVDGQERPLAEAAVMVNRARDQLLAGAAFAGDEGGGVGGRELADELEYILHRLAAANDAQIVILRFQQRLIGNDLFHVTRGFEPGGNKLFQFRHIKRLEQIIVSAQFHRFDGRLCRAVSGHHDHGKFGVRLTNPAQCLQAVHSSQTHIHDDQVGPDPRDQLQPFFAAGGGAQFNLRQIKNPAERILHVRFVIDQQQPFHNIQRRRQDKRLCGNCIEILQDGTAPNRASPAQVFFFRLPLLFADGPRPGVAHSR